MLLRGTLHSWRIIVHLYHGGSCNVLGEFEQRGRAGVVGGDVELDGWNNFLGAINVAKQVRVYNLQRGWGGVCLAGSEWACRCVHLEQRRDLHPRITHRERWSWS